jgi:hypothetical protein
MNINSAESWRCAIKVRYLPIFWRRAVFEAHSAPSVSAAENKSGSSLLKSSPTLRAVIKHHLAHPRPPPDQQLPDKEFADYRLGAVG